VRSEPELSRDAISNEGLFFFFVNIIIFNYFNILMIKIIFKK
jgi:hypothetical protein